MILLLIKSVNKAEALRITSAAIYGCCMVLVFLSSALYHSMMQPRARRLFLVLDHSAIFLAIAGTYTPLSLVLLRGPLGWSLLIIVWSLAIAGIFFKTRFINRFDFVSTLIYVVLGWMVLFVIRSLTAAMSSAGLYLFFAGGLVYTVGTIFYAWKGFQYHHMVWHLFVLAGAALHFLSLYLHVF